MDRELKNDKTMGKIESLFIFYAVGVMLAAMIVAYDLRNAEREGYMVHHSGIFAGIAFIYLLSWGIVLFRFAVWLTGILQCWIVWIILKYKLWKINRSKRTTM